MVHNSNKYTVVDNNTTLLAAAVASTKKLEMYMSKKKKKAFFSKTESFLIYTRSNWKSGKTYYYVKLNKRYVLTMKQTDLEKMILSNFLFSYHATTSEVRKPLS